MKVFLTIFLLIFFCNLYANENLMNKEKYANDFFKSKDSSEEVVDFNLDKKKDGKFTYWYFNPDKFGARAFHNPIQFIVEGGLPGGKALYNVDFANGMSEVFKRVINPIKYVSDYGWKKFIYYEFIPHRGKGGNWIPNYTWHLWGGGFRTRLMIEYFHYHKYKNPAIWGWATMYVLHFFNESSQMVGFNKLPKNASLTGTSNDVVDSIPDLFFFDWIGGVLFSYDPINRFVTKHLHLSEWSYQSQINLATGRLLNNGQAYWMRYQLGESPFSISLLTGTQMTGPGFSYEYREGHYLSWNYGATLSTIDRNENGDLVPGSTVVSLAFSYSIKDNPLLLATLSLPDYKAMKLHPQRRNQYDLRLRINLYPGVVKFLGMNIGLSFAYQRRTVFFGITNGDWPLGTTIGDKKPILY